MGILPHVDLVLVMSVNPGLAARLHQGGGRKYVRWMKRVASRASPFSSKLTAAYPR